MNHRRTLRSALALFTMGPGTSLPAGAANPPDATVATVAPTKLTATLIDPINVDLKWRNESPAVRGYLVEYTSDPRDEYVILTFVPPDTTSFRHPDLAPQTKYFYRIRPFLGEASPIVRVTTGKNLSESDTGLIDGAEPVIDSADAVIAAQKKSLRKPPPAASATPSDLTAALAAPLTVTLRWKDRANDEDGYLVEAAAPGQNDFEVIAFLPADVIGFTVPQLPPETECRFRVRAFFYGPSSNVVEKTTGAEPRSAVLSSSPDPS